MEIQEGRAEQDPDRNSRPGIRHRSKRDDRLSSRSATCRSSMHFSMTSWTCGEVPPGQDSVSGDRRRRRSGLSVRLASSDPRVRLSSCACKARQPAGPDRAMMPEVRSGPAHAVRHQAPAKPSHPGASQRKAARRQPWLAASPGDGHAPVGGSHEFSLFAKVEFNEWAGPDGTIVHHPAAVPLPAHDRAFDDRPVGLAPYPVPLHLPVPTGSRRGV